MIRVYLLMGGRERSEPDVLYRSRGFAQKLLATDFFQTALGDRFLRPNKGWNAGNPYLFEISEVLP